LEAVAQLTQLNKLTVKASASVFHGFVGLRLGVQGFELADAHLKAIAQLTQLKNRQ
jgi:hypothetical protein